MKVLRFYAPEGRPDRGRPGARVRPGRGQLRVRNCSTCGTDVKIFHNGHQNLSAPRIIGHEVAGEVVEVAPTSAAGRSVTAPR
jgi:L-iditol 2-dehydrogenase